MRTFLASIILTLYLNFALAAPPICGDPPVVANERVKGEVEAQANAIGKLLGALGFGAAYEESREDIFSKYGESNAARADQYLYFLVCNIVTQNTGLTYEQKLDTIFKMRSAMSGGATAAPDTNYMPESENQGGTGGALDYLDPTMLPQPVSSMPIHPEIARRPSNIVLQTALPAGESCTGPSVVKTYPSGFSWDSKRTVKILTREGDIEFDAPITRAQFELLRQWVNDKFVILEYFECRDFVLVSRLAG